MQSLVSFSTYLMFVSKEQYFRRFKKWGLSKNSTSNYWAIVAHKVRKRKLSGKESAIYINGSMIPRKKARKEISRYAQSIWDECSRTGDSFLVLDYIEGFRANNYHSPQPSDTIGHDDPYSGRTTPAHD